MARGRRAQAEQAELPGTEQARDQILEREGAKLAAVKDEIAALQKNKAEIEARIFKRFDEFEEDDPRREGYRLKSGSILYPRKIDRLKITRPPAVRERANVSDDDD